LVLQLLNRSECLSKGIEARSRGERPRRAVLKFGSSVLHDHHDLPRVAGEIYRQSLRFRQLIVVVSAYEGQTDELFSRYKTISGVTDCDGCADVVSLGEELTAAQLNVACSRIGLRATVLRPEQWGITAEGAPLEASPTRLPALPSDIPAEGIIIVPGFVALNNRGDRVLLGRGGSDFTAIYLAGELNADCLRLYKDVDGVYDHDPAKDEDNLHRFEAIEWSRCLEIARPLLQPNAIQYAKEKRLPLEVGSIGSLRPTVVAHNTRLTEVSHRRPLRVGIAGFGVVGQALYRRLLREPDFSVTDILVRDLNKHRDIYPPFALTDDLESFLEAKFDILIDVTCGEEAGLPLSHRQLERGGALVSANKTVVEPWFEDLEALGSRQGGYFGISACVGGGTPILEAIERFVGCPRIERVEAVLNGTVNFLLDQLGQGHSFEAALRRAQEAGFAEDDPTQDLSGQDAEIKLRLIARHAFNCLPNDIEIRTEALTPARIGKIWKSSERWIQLARLARDGDSIIGSISFALTTGIEELPDLPAERNFARVTLADGRRFDVEGRGAGGAPTAEAIMMDMFAFLNSASRNLGEPGSTAGAAK
jgi:homoserine dehydrogenase